MSLLSCLPQPPRRKTGADQPLPRTSRSQSPSPELPCALVRPQRFFVSSWVGQLQASGFWTNVQVLPENGDDSQGAVRFWAWQLWAFGSGSSEAYHVRLCHNRSSNKGRSPFGFREKDTRRVALAPLAPRLITANKEFSRGQQARVQACAATFKTVLLGVSPFW